MRTLHRSAVTWSSVRGARGVLERFAPTEVVGAPATDAADSLETVQMSPAGGDLKQLAANAGVNGPFFGVAVALMKEI